MKKPTTIKQVLDDVTIQIFGVVFLCAVVVVPLIFLAKIDQQVHTTNVSMYCDMVSVWDDNTHIPEERRPGWPPYKGRSICELIGE